MQMIQLEKLLSGGDLRSIGKTNSVILQVQDQRSFDELFKCLFSAQRVVVMRAADAIEKITLQHPAYLTKHKKTLLEFCRSAINKELKWHLALLISRLNLSGKEMEIAWQILTGWASDKKESRIVRVNSLQSLYNFSLDDKKLTKKFETVVTEIKKENIPSLIARIKKLKYNKD